MAVRERTMIVPVTDKLKEELAATGRVLAQLDKLELDQQASRSRHHGVNDRDHFVEVVDTLEPLVIAALSATSSVPLSKRDLKPGARFNMGAGTELAYHVTACVAYLKDTASGLLAANDFSQYKGDAVDVALGMLKKLNGMLLAGIIKQAEADLDAVKAKGAMPLIAAAQRLASLASAKGAPTDGPVDIREASVSLPRVAD